MKTADFPKFLTDSLLAATPAVIGRESECENLQILLAKATDTVVVGGTTGIGKSTLVRHYIDKNHEQWSHIVWLDFTDSIEDALLGSSLAQTLNINESEVPEGMLFREIITRLEALPGAKLFVVHNIDLTTDAMINIVPTGWQLLLTTPENEALSEPAHLVVNKLSPESARRLFEAHCPDKCNEGELNSLLEYVGYYPMAIKLIACAIATEKELDLKQVSARLQKLGLVLAEENDNSEMEEQLCLIISKLFDLTGLDTQYQNERWYLIQLSVLPAAMGFSLETLQFLLQEDVDDDDLPKVLDFLTAKGWISVRKDKATGKESYHVHRSIQELVIERYAPDADACEEVLATLYSIFVEQNTDNPVAQKLCTNDVLGEVLTNVEDTETHEKYIFLTEAMAIICKKSGKLEEAIGWYNDFLKGGTQAQVAINYDKVFDAYAFLTEAYILFEDYVPVQTYLPVLYQLLENYPGEDLPRLATARNLEGLVRTHLEMYEEAKTCFLESMDMGKTLKDKLLLTSAEVNMAWLDCSAGNYKTALEHATLALASNLKYSQVRHPQTGACHFVMGSIYYLMDEAQKAREFLDKAHDIYTHSLRKNHPNFVKLQAWRGKLEQEGH